MDADLLEFRKVGYSRIFSKYCASHAHVRECTANSATIPHQDKMRMRGMDWEWGTWQWKIAHTGH